MYDVSLTTISRIKKGENHTQYKNEYEKLPLEERKNIYRIFCEVVISMYRKFNKLLSIQIVN